MDGFFFGGVFGLVGVEAGEGRGLGWHLLVLEFGEEGLVGGVVEGVAGGVHGVEEAPEVGGVVLVAADDAEHEVVGGGAGGEGGEVGGEVVEELQGFWGFLVELLEDVED